MSDDVVKTILVTGANGFIGSRLCRRLAANGYAIRILCRESSDLTLLKDIQYSKSIGDITDPESLAAAVSGVDYIIHSAGLIKAKNEAAYFRVNQTGTVNLLNAVKNNNLDLKKFILISSVAAAGPADKIPRKESDPCLPLTTYGRSKLAGEDSARPFFDLIPITILRPPAVYGPGDRAILTLFDLANKGIKPYMAGGHNRIQMVYVDDLCRAIQVAMESDHSRGQTYFIADGQAHSVRELMDKMGQLLGKKGIGIYIPLWLLRIIALLSEGFFRMIGKTPLFSREKVRELTANWLLDVSHARDQIGFETKFDFTAGATEAITWYRKEGWLK